MNLSWHQDHDDPRYHRAHLHRGKEVGWVCEMSTAGVTWWARGPDVRVPGGPSYEIGKYAFKSSTGPSNDVDAGKLAVERKVGKLWEKKG